MKRKTLVSQKMEGTTSIETKINEDLTIDGGEGSNLEKCHENKELTENPPKLAKKRKRNRKKKNLKSNEISVESAKNIGTQTSSESGNTFKKPESPPPKEGLFEIIRKSISCEICFEVLVNPHITECGHSYCYTCIHTWTLKGESQCKTCPSCRHKLRVRPALNHALTNCINIMVSQLPADESAIIAERISNGNEKFKKTANPWEDWRETITTGWMFDEEDQVHRCTNCNAEIVDGFCSRCERFYDDIPTENSVIDLNSYDEVYRDWSSDEENLYNHMDPQEEDGFIHSEAEEGNDFNYERESYMEEYSNSEEEEERIHYYESDEGQGPSCFLDTMADEESDINVQREIYEDSKYLSDGDSDNQNMFLSPGTRRSAIILSDDDSDV